MIIQNSKVLPFFLSIIVLISFLGCISDDRLDCQNYTIKVKLVDPGGESISSKAVDSMNIYMFNETGFVRTISTTKKKDLNIGYNEGQNITFVLWGNLNMDSLLVDLKNGTSLSDAKVQLRKAGGYDLTSTDLFYSRCNTMEQSSNASVLPRSTQSVFNGDTLTMYMERMVASMTITGKHICEHYKTDTSGYRFVVSGTKNSLNFLGEASGKKVDYAPTSFFDSYGNYFSPTFRVLPTGTDEYLTILLYRGNNLLFSTNKNSDGEVLKAVAGMQMNISLDFMYSDVRIKVNVTPWGEIWQDTNI